jgi:hypothetical protein
MSIAMPVAFVAFCVWLTVRIFNRRERWAIRTAVGLVVLSAYPLSFGPACWLSSWTEWGDDVVSIVYQPIVSWIPVSPKFLSFASTTLLTSRKSRSSIGGRTIEVVGAIAEMRAPNVAISSFAKILSADGWNWVYVMEKRRSADGVDLLEGRWEWRFDFTLPTPIPVTSPVIVPDMPVNPFLPDPDTPSESN